jgi:large subunit ribosomal protein L18e
VGTVTNDERILVLPKLRVCALKFTEKARERIVKAGGQCMTFDELVMMEPMGGNTVLLRGPKHREALRHFGPAPACPHSHTRYLTSLINQI